MAHHLTLEEHEIVAHMRSKYPKPTKIARRLGRADSTISRELQQNRSGAVAAQKKADTRRRQRLRLCKLQRAEVRRYVEQRLRQYWSPDQIAVRSRVDFPRDRRRQVLHQTIYAWIQAQDATGQHWRRYLRSTGWKRRNCGNRTRIPACTSIEGRPTVVVRCSRYGDWEGDTVDGAGRRGGAVTLVERKSGYLLMGKAHNLRATTVRQSASALYRTTPPVLWKTLTLDNGKEFSEHQQLEAEALLKICFAKPYYAWQRGSNEHTNGLICQFFPKGTDLVRVPEHRFIKIQQLLNNRPRKRLGYRTPLEVLRPKLLLAFDT